MHCLKQWKADIHYKQYHTNTFMYFSEIDITVRHIQNMHPLNCLVNLTGAKVKNSNNATSYLTSKYVMIG